MVYKRDSKLQQCWEYNMWYGEKDGSEYSENLIYNPDDTAMDTLAMLKPEWFVYERPFLLSVDRRILYGFSVNDKKELKIPSSVKVYDNLFLHEENKGYETIYINGNLENIVNVQNCFGFYVRQYIVSEENVDYTAVDGILYDNTESGLILFPSGKGMTDAYCQISLETKSIGKYAFFMKEFIRTLVIPPSVKVIDDDAFTYATDNDIGNGRKPKVIIDMGNKNITPSIKLNDKISGIDIYYL